MEKRYQLNMNDALVVVDMQNCFLPGGNLGIAGSDVIIHPINLMIRRFAERGLPVALSRDWHPRNHISFREQGGPWPVHGIAGTTDAAFSPDLIIPEEALVFSKATDKNSEEYSAFHAKSDSGLTLQKWLEQHKTKRVWVGGLATDYCVLNTVQELRQAGYTAMVLVDAVYAVNVNAGDGERALRKMAENGALLIETRQVEEQA